MRTLSFLTFALLFGVPCFGKMAHLVRNHPVPIAGVPTPNHVNSTRNGNCGEFCQLISDFVTSLLSEYQITFQLLCPPTWQVPLGLIRLKLLEVKTHLHLSHGKSQCGVGVPIFVGPQFWMNQLYFALLIVFQGAHLHLVKPSEQVQHKDQVVVRYLYF